MAMNISDTTREVENLIWNDIKERYENGDENTQAYAYADATKFMNQVVKEGQLLLKEAELEEKKDSREKAENSREKAEKLDYELKMKQLEYEKERLDFEKEKFNSDFLLKTKANELEENRLKFEEKKLEEETKRVSRSDLKHILIEGAKIGTTVLCLGIGLAIEREGSINFMTNRNLFQKLLKQ